MVLSREICGRPRKLPERPDPPRLPIQKTSYPVPTFFAPLREAPHTFLAPCPPAGRRGRASRAPPRRPVPRPRQLDPHDSAFEQLRHMRPEALGDLGHHRKSLRAAAKDEICELGLIKEAVLVFYVYEVAAARFPQLCKPWLRDVLRSESHHRLEPAQYRFKRIHRHKWLLTRRAILEAVIPYAGYARAVGNNAAFPETPLEGG